MARRPKPPVFLQETFDAHAAGFERIFRLCRHETGTSRERMAALYAATHHVLNEGIPGDFVECGVWRGGSSMLIAAVLAQQGVRDRMLWLYDTFEGMTEPTEKDVDLGGAVAAALMEAGSDTKETSPVWCYAGLEVVRANMGRTGYPADLIRYVVGPVEETIPASCPDAIALLRLDTDWYASTRHELIHLYPRLSSGGALIIDDYGHWQGCREAVDEYFADHPLPVPLFEIDYTGRAAVKPKTA